VALALTAASAGAARAGQAPPLEQSEKCEDLQTRCLHRENAICQVWHDECMEQHHVAATHGAHKPHKHEGREKRRF
jgi:hypothetical protein